MYYNNLKNNKIMKNKNSSKSYVSVGKNIYRDGSSYRARVSVDGTRFSRNCRTKREAIEWRNEMLAEQA